MVEPCEIWLLLLKLLSLVAKPTPASTLSKFPLPAPPAMLLIALAV
ncbi:hypothetical protein ABUK36_21915 [Xanthomonas citri pv. mangiferaeindicae]